MKVITDLGAVDRLAGRAAHALLDGQGDLLETAFREVAKQTVHAALVPLSPKLAAHVAHFTVVRIAGPSMRALDAARSAPSSTVSNLPRTQTKEPRVSIADALLEALAARSLEAARAWLAVVQESSTPAIDAERHLREIATEIEKRLGLSDDRELAGAAESFLAKTNELALSIADEPAAALLLANARSAGEGWPRRPSPQFAIEAFGSDIKAKRTIERLASRSRRTFGDPIGAASHLRAMRAMIFDWHARSPGDAAFSARHEPEWTEAHASSLLVASALASPAFHKRALGCVARTARAQARALAATGLVAARTDAARILAATEERSERLFGRPIAPIVPRPRMDARGRFRAWLALPALLDRANALHDEDWFRNPRFWEEMEIRFASPPEPIAGGDLPKLFEERLA
jgi:hypothetical protein